MYSVKLKKIRKKIFNILEAKDYRNKLSDFYNIFMLIIVIVSIVPLMFKEDYYIFYIVDVITVSLFIIDYLMRWFTADIALNKKKKSFLIYPLTPLAIVDLLSIFPSLGIIHSIFKILRILRIFKTFRVFKAARYSKNFRIILTVIKKESNILISVFTLAVAYILISALIMYNVEPENFNSFFESIYWATLTLTTIGYGDIHPITESGKIVSMVSAIFGIALIALPSSILTAGFMNEVKKSENKI